MISIVYSYVFKFIFYYEMVEIQCGLFFVFVSVAWFAFDTNTAFQDVLFSNNNTTITSSSFDERVVLGTVGLTKGVHYWEVFIDRFENNKDPAIGVARYDVAKDKMLGTEEDAKELGI